MLRVITVAALCVLFGAETGMTGGWTEQNAGDEEYLNRAWKATKFINDNANNGGPYHMIPIKVVKAKSQVVAGINYELEVLVGESTCKKEDISATELTSANCQLKSNSSRVLFKISLWEKPWENFEQFNVEKIRDVDVDEQI